MDMRLFHNSNCVGRSTRAMDRNNSYTSLIPVRILELIGWYSSNVSYRLLGHYRLFHNFRKGYPEEQQKFPAIQAYILQYRMMHGVKYFFARLMAFFMSTGTYRSNYLWVDVAGINHLLVNESSDILVQFLANADDDFEAALKKAVQQIAEPSFIHKPNKNNLISASVSVNFNNKTTNYNNDFSDRSQKIYMPLINHTNTFDLSQELHLSSQPIISYGAQGKEKDVFSKRQILILLDLFASATKLEKIDYNKPTRFNDIACMLQAITGKEKDSWIKELNGWKNVDPYHCETDGERDELIRSLTNLAKFTRQGGFRSIADLADKKAAQIRGGKKT